VAGRGELIDEVWERIRPLLPGNGRGGRKWRDHRTVVNGILWRLRTGAPWRDVPKRYGPPCKPATAALITGDKTELGRGCSRGFRRTPI
jgi:transposase